MQAHFIKETHSMKAGYIDPQPIAQTVFNYPKKWKLDGKELAGGKMREEKEDIREAKIREEGLKVVAWIVVCLKNIQHFETIWIPYNFK
jgi:hypothetical protein